MKHNPDYYGELERRRNLRDFEVEWEKRNPNLNVHHVEIAKMMDEIRFLHERVKFLEEKIKDEI